ncbi:MAG: pantetheine-phosphate adenylyltransferase [Minisyncoccales bacterium]|jgi:pantetheine-phosphate adenylyltransferase
MIDKKTIVGGTFDLFHKGHETLLENAFKLGIVVVGLTSNKMALQRKQREVEDYKERENSILRFANSQNKNIKIKKIEDSIGFSLDDSFERIVVTKDNKETAEEINEKREKEGKTPLEIVEVDLLLAKDGKPISSTRIRNGEIDKDGNLI